MAAGSQAGSVPVYGQLGGREQVQVVTFNHTTLAAAASPSSIYFNGDLTHYVDVENKNDLQVTTSCRSTFPPSSPTVLPVS